MGKYMKVIKKASFALIYTLQTQKLLNMIGNFILTRGEGGRRNKFFAAGKKLILCIILYTPVLVRNIISIYFGPLGKYIFMDWMMIRLTKYLHQEHN